MIVKITKRLVLLTVVLLTIVSCSTSRGTISSSAELYKYKYAAIRDIMSYGGSASLYDMSVQIYDSLDNQSHLIMIGEKELASLSDEDAKATLLIKYAIEINMVSCTATLSLVDYTTERPIANFIAKETLWWNTTAEIDSATRKCISKCIEELKASL